MRFTRRALAVGVVLTWAVFGGGAGAFLSWPTAATAQSPQNLPQSVAPPLKVYSRETIVDVTVTDAKGNPVHGLTRDDFTVMEDGKPQPIKSFAEFGRKEVQPLPKLPPNIYTNLQPPAPNGATNVIWLDFTNAAPVLFLGCCDPPFGLTAGAKDLALALGYQRRTKVAVMAYLKQMPPGTRVAVFGTWYPPGRLRVLQGVTSDPALLSAAVDTMPYDQDGAFVLKRGVQPLDSLQAPEDWCAQQERRNRMTAESLNQMAADLAQIKGRKNLLWFTMRIQTLVNVNLPCLSDLSKDVKRAYGLLAAAQVTVYPISVRGVEENSIEHGDDNLGLETVAEATGGAAFYNSNDLADLAAKAANSGSEYYTLSYVPPGNEYDGRHHTIKLVAAVPNLHLTYRNSYYAEDPAAAKPAAVLTLATTLSDSDKPDMKLAMGRSMPTSQQLLFDVQVDPSTLPAKPSDPAIFGTLDPAFKARLKGKPLTRYSFQYAIPALQIEFPRDPNAAPGSIRNGALEVDIAAYDDQGKLVTGLSQTIKMPLTTAQYRQFIKSPYLFTQQLDLPPGQLFLRIGVLDPTSNKVGTLEIPLTAGKSSIAQKPEAVTPHGGKNDR